MAEYQELTCGMDDGAHLGSSPAKLVGCYGAVPVTQCALSAAPTTTAGCVTAIAALVSCLTSFGIMASA